MLFVSFYAFLWEGLVGGFIMPVCQTLPILLNPRALFIFLGVVLSAAYVSCRVFLCFMYCLRDLYEKHAAA